LSQSPLFELTLYPQPLGLNKLMQRPRKKLINEYKSSEESVDTHIASHKSAASTSYRQDIFYFLLSAIDLDTNASAFSNTRHNLLSDDIDRMIFYRAHNPRVLPNLTATIRNTFSSTNGIFLSPK
ncbi:hypothetical protein P280DRAFT_411372, partial [Massarina eburnea CBS 473.64]